MVTNMVFVIVIFILVSMVIPLSIVVTVLYRDNRNLVTALEKISECKKCPVCGMLAWKALNPEEKNRDKR